MHYLEHTCSGSIQLQNLLCFSIFKMLIKCYWDITGIFIPTCTFYWYCCTCFALHTWSNKRPWVVTMNNTFEICCPSFPCLSQSHVLTVFQHLLACGFSKTAAQYDSMIGFIQSSTPSFISIFSVVFITVLSLLSIYSVNFSLYS